MTPMELRRWPRKNDPDSIRARQEVVRDLTADGEVLWDDLEPVDAGATSRSPAWR